jgi:hypothetical protein
LIVATTGHENCPLERAPEQSIGRCQRIDQHAALAKSLPHYRTEGIRSAATAHSGQQQSLDMVRPEIEPKLILIVPLGRVNEKASCLAATVRRTIWFFSLRLNKTGRTGWKECPRWPLGC